MCHVSGQLSGVGSFYLILKQALPCLLCCAVYWPAHFQQTPLLHLPSHREGAKYRYAPRYLPFFYMRSRD